MTTLALYDRLTGTRPASINVKITPALVVALQHSGFLILSATPVKEK